MSGTATHPEREQKSKMLPISQGRMRLAGTMHSGLHLRNTPLVQRSDLGIGLEETRAKESEVRWYYCSDDHNEVLRQMRKKRSIRGKGGKSSKMQNTKNVFPALM